MKQFVDADFLHHSIPQQVLITAWSWFQSFFCFAVSLNMAIAEKSSNFLAWKGVSNIVLVLTRYIMSSVTQSRTDHTAAHSFRQFAREAVVVGLTAIVLPWDTECWGPNCTNRLPPKCIHLLQYTWPPVLPGLTVLEYFQMPKFGYLEG